MKKKWAKTTAVFCLAASSVLLSACSSGTSETSASAETTAAAAGTETSGGETSGAASEGEAAGTTDFSGKEIEIATYLTGDTLEAYKEVIAGFESETGVKVTLDEYGEDYENTMKIRMASNDLPDVFETHG